VRAHAIGVGLDQQLRQILDEELFELGITRGRAAMEVRADAEDRYGTSAWGPATYMPEEQRHPDHDSATERERSEHVTVGRDHQKMTTAPAAGFT
jgi:hypothetical protein